LRLKKNTIFLLLVFVFVALFSVAGLLYLQYRDRFNSQLPDSTKTISVVMDDNYPPYIYRNSDGELQGILVDQWALWSKETGVTAEIHAMDWADALTGMKNGEYDVIDTIFYNEERDTWLDFTKAYATIDVPIFHSNSISGITNAESLRGFTVAVKAEDNCISILQAAGVTDIEAYPSYESIVDAAKDGAISVFVIDEPPALYFLYQKGIAKEFSRSQSLYSGEFHRAVAKGDMAMLNLVEDGFAKISTDQLNRIDDKWYGREGSFIYLSYFIEYVLIGTAIIAVVIIAIILWNYRLRKEVRKKTAELMHEKELMRITLQSIGDGVVATGMDGTISLMNPTARKMSGWGDEAIGAQFSDVLYLINEKTEKRVASPIEKVLETGEIVGLANHTALVNKSGMKIPIADGAAPIRDQNGTIYGVVMVFRDVTPEKQQRDKIEHIMSHDSMTGLYNRWYMEEQLKQYEENPELQCALIMGDLNGLKLINDAFGHNEGDHFIKKIASILTESTGELGVVSRWGGDEFLILLPDATAQEANQVIAKISSRCVEESDNKLQLSIALGYAIKSETEDDIRNVLRDAEQLTYRRKLMIEKSFRSSVINALLSTLAAKSEETEEHAERLRESCEKVGNILGISAKEMDEMSLFAMLHDIGKVGINDSILQKPSALTDEEWLEMRKHPEIGFRIAQNNVDLAPISEYILSHHERWDGKGYPRGLVGEEIPILSRILAVVDAYDAMTNDRIYSQQRSKEAAIAEILKNAGTQFDPRIARVFVEEVIKF